LVISCLILNTSAEKKDYTGYQVVRISLPGTNVSDVHRAVTSVNRVSERLLLDVWATNVPQGWMDVMIPPHLTSALDSLFPGLLYVVRIENVQATIDESERDMASGFRSGADPIFDNFRNYAAIQAWMQTKVGPRATFGSIGNSYLGTPVNSLTIKDPNVQNPKTIIIYCGIHAREWITPPHCLWAIEELLAGNHNDLLEQMQFIIIPVLNVDGYAYTFSNDRLWRKNRRPNPGSSCVGTDLNRNYAVGWGGPGASPQPCSEIYQGPSAFSGPETALIRDLVNRVGGSLVSFWDLHAYGSLWMSAWGYSCSNPPDYAEMNAMMQDASQAVFNVNGRSYSYGPICSTIYQASGSSVDWAYKGTSNTVVHAYTSEAFGSSFTAPVSHIIPVSTEVWAGIVRTAENLLE